VRSLSLALVGLGLACSPPGGDVRPDVEADRRQPSVYVVNYPLQYFAERIAGDALEVRFPAPRREDPAQWAPAPETITAYQRADRILLNGADYAAWVGRATLPRRSLVDTSAGFADRLIPVEAAVSHRHGPQGDHSHRAWATHTWLDPDLAREQARAIANSFASTWPEHAALFERGWASLDDDLRMLDGEIETATDTLGDTPILFSHPVYPYLQRRYGLNGRSLHWEPHRVPEPAQWRELERVLASHPARLLIWEAEPAPETVRRLEALGIRSVVYEPCSNAPETGDWLGVMRRNAERLRDAPAPESPVR